MKKSRILLLAAALAGGVSAPALAAYDKVATIDVGSHADRDSVSPDFGGPVERLQLTARGSDVQCSYIRATYGNGSQSILFRGRLTRNSAYPISLPGVTQRNVRRITSNCHAAQRGGASIDIYADVGQYQDAWRRSPNWVRMWSHMFNWGNGPSGGYSPTPAPGEAGDWDPLTTVRFTGRDNRENDAVGLGGHNVTILSLKPLDGDAQCARVTATFGNGNRRDLDIPRGVMRRDVGYKVDLPGNLPNVTRLSMLCRPTNGYAVSIRVSGRH